jgi:hypothetical protein
MIARDDHGERPVRCPPSPARACSFACYCRCSRSERTLSGVDTANKPGRRMINPMTQRKQFVNRRVEWRQAKSADARQALDSTQPAAPNMTRTLQPGPADPASPSPETVESRIDAQAFSRRGNNHARTLRRGSPLQRTLCFSIAFVVKAATCSSVRRISRGSDIHSRIMARRASCSGFIF